MDTLTELVKKLVSIASTYPHEEKMGEYIEGLFKDKAGVRVRTQQVEGRRKNIIVEKGKGKKIVVLYAHLDTVGIVDGWNTNPHAPKVTGDRVYGIGVYDMKGGMAVNIQTFLNTEPKNYRLQLLFCVDEENISKGGHVYADSPLMRDVSCVLSPEPAFIHGVNGIVTGRIGRAVVEVKLTLPSSHFYYYEPEKDLHILASQIIQKLKLIYSKRKDKKEFIFVRKFQSEAVGMSTPQEVFIELDMAVLPPRTNADMLRLITNIVINACERFPSNVTSSVAFRKRETPFLSGYELKDNDYYLEEMKMAVKRVTRKKAIPYFRSSVADENIFGSNGKSVLGIGPVGGNAHGANEWVSRSSLVELQKIYENFLQSIDKKED